MDTTKFYTAQITLNEKKEGTNDHVVLEFHDMTFQQMQEFKQRAFVQGVQRQTSPICWELIDPLRVKQILFIQQPQKYKP